MLSPIGKEEVTTRIVIKKTDWKSLLTPSLKKVVACESSFREDVYGDGGLAYGPFQFHKRTFEWMAKSSGLTMADYYDPLDQTKIALWAFKNGYASHWTCAYKVGLLPPKPLAAKP